MIGKVVQRIREGKMHIEHRHELENAGFVFMEANQLEELDVSY